MVRFDHPGAPYVHETRSAPHELGEDGLITGSEVAALELPVLRTGRASKPAQEAGFTRVKLAQPFDGAPSNDADLETVVEATRP